MIRLLQTHRVFVAILALGLFTMAARGMADPDAWWHLRTGQLILQNQRVFHTDPFSFTRFGQPWINHEWLSGVLMYGVYRIGGFGGLIVTFAVVVASSFLLVFARCPGRPYWASLITLWGAVASASTWGARPQMFTLLFASVFLLLLEASEKRPNLLWWVAPLMLLWVNLHAGYPVGLGFLAIFLIGEGLEAGISPQPWRASLPRLKGLAAAFGLCLALVAVNPYGLRLYVYPLETLRSTAIQGLIQEWFSPNFHDRSYLPLLLLLLGLIAGLAWSPVRPRVRSLLLLLVTVPAALAAVRHIPILVLVIVPVLAHLGEAWLQHAGAVRLLKKPPTVQASRTLVINFLVISAFAVFTVLRVRHVVSLQTETERRSFPAAAVAFLEREHPPTPMLNHYNFGGYFIGKLHPEFQVYMDGRSDLYGDALMADFGHAYNLTADWNKTLEEWNIRTVVLPPDAPLITALKSTPDWKVIFGDAQAIVLTRTH